MACVYPPLGVICCLLSTRRRCNTPRATRSYTRSAASVTAVTLNTTQDECQESAGMIVNQHTEIQQVPEGLAQETVATTTDQQVSGTAAAVSIMHPDGTETTIPIELVGTA